MQHRRQVKCKKFMLAVGKQHSKKENVLVSPKILLY